jgi:prepilin-type N-terminal cleavage/methylation domain-containing protein
MALRRSDEEEAMKVRPHDFRGGVRVPGWNRPGHALGAHGGSRSSGAVRAFSLVELLVVMAIIGLLAAIGLPALKGLTGGTGVNSANRQLMDDLALARMTAINDRTTVYVVFISPTIVSDRSILNGLNSDERRELQKLLNGQYTTYALYAPRSLGDQPGPGTRHYLTEWRSLPAGVFINTNKFDPSFSAPNMFNTWKQLPPTNRPMAFFDVPFPFASSKTARLPGIAFDYQGKLLYPGDEIIPFDEGSIVYATDSKGQYTMDVPEVIETPKGNETNNPILRIDWLTGRARAEGATVVK